MTTTATHTIGQHRAAVLRGLRGHQADRDAAEIEMPADDHRVGGPERGRARSGHAHHGFFGDRPIPLAGEGAPLVSEFASMEYAAARGMSTEPGYA